MRIISKITSIPTPRRFAAVATVLVALFLPAFVLTSASCADPPPSVYPSQQVYEADTTLGPGDIFDVRVFRQEDLSGTYSVSSEGTIAFPLIGEVAVAGKTPVAVERELRMRLADGYLRNPQVSVLVKEYKSKKLSVFGQVREPGTLSYVEGMSVVEAIAQAGGFTDLARKNAVTVTRKRQSAPTTVAATTATTATTATATTTAVGESAVSDSGASAPDGERFTVPVEDIGRGTAPNFYLRPGDVIFVPRRMW